MKPRITVITVGVDDLKQSLAFYRDGLGLEPCNVEIASVRWRHDIQHNSFRTAGIVGAASLASRAGGGRAAGSSDLAVGGRRVLQLDPGDTAMSSDLHQPLEEAV